jgi:hypothetical protein
MVYLVVLVGLYTPRALTFDEFLNWEDLMCRHGFAGLRITQQYRETFRWKRRSWKTPRQHTYIECVRLHVLAVCAPMSIRRDPLSVNSNFARAVPIDKVEFKRAF